MMVLSTGRLVMRKYTTADKEKFIAVYTNDAVMKYITGRALTPAEATAKYEQAILLNSRPGKSGYFSVYTKADGCYIGLAKLVYPDPVTETCLEVGFCLFPEFHGAGYATEITRRLVDHARESCSAKQLIAIIDPLNHPSRNVLLKNNFVLSSSGTYEGLPSETYSLAL